MITRKYRMVIGRNEPIILGDYNAELQIPAKADTGAYRSSIHCGDITVTKNEDGTQTLRGVLLKGHPCGFGGEFPIETNQFERVRVANSFGHTEYRYEVKIRIKIGPLSFPTTVTLADRSKKLFPVLLGRKALSKRFLVDSAFSNVDRIKLKQKFGSSVPDDDEDFIVE